MPRFSPPVAGGGGGGASAPPDSPLNPTGATIAAPPGTPSLSTFESFNAYTPNFGLTCTFNPDNSCMAGTVRAVASGGNVGFGGSTVTAFSDNHLELIGASAAYARGATGRGERVVVIDSGIDQSHREFPGDKVAVVTGIGDSCSPTDAADGECANAEHGTAVAAVAAGARGTSSAGVDMHGVAFDAKITFIPTRLRGDSTKLPPLLHLNGRTWGPSDRDDFDKASANYRRYIAQGKILNLSFGRPWATSEWETLGNNCGIAGSGALACYRYYYQPVASALAQSGTRAADRSIIVQSAANYNGERYDRVKNGDGAGAGIDATSPIADALLPHVFSELEMGHYVVVVAVGADGEIADYSNRCGVAENFCIAAPGGDGGDALSGGGVDAGILSATAGGQYDAWQGTSFAAPVVSGALAVMRSYFRNPDGSRSVGNTELVNRLLATANRNGRYADGDIYGRGLLDLDAATRPMGPMMTASGAPLAGTALEITRGAFSDAMARALNGKQMAVFDQLGTPFFRDAGGLLRPGARGDAHSFAEVTAGRDKILQLDSGMWIAQNHNGGRSLGLLGEGEGFAFSSRNAFAAPFFSLVQNGLGAGFSGTTPGRAGLGFAFMHGAPQGDGGALGDWEPGTAVALNYRPRNIAFSVQAGVVREAESFLGARPGGGMGAASGDTVFAGLGGEWRVGHAWRALLAGFIGWTKTQTSPGMLRGVSDLRSSALSIGLWRRSALHSNDWLGFRLSQPLRVESGRANLRLATARTRHGEILYDDIQANLKPRGRALEAEAAWQSPTAGGDLSLGLKLTHNPGHNPAAGTREFAWARFRKAF